eukprot:superscaffoldBa00004010_g18105
MEAERGIPEPGIKPQTSPSAPRRQRLGSGDSGAPPSKLAANLNDVVNDILRGPGSVERSSYLDRVRAARFPSSERSSPATGAATPRYPDGAAPDLRKENPEIKNPQRERLELEPSRGKTRPDWGEGGGGGGGGHSLLLRGGVTVITERCVPTAASSADGTLGELRPATERREGAVSRALSATYRRQAARDVRAE